MKRQRYTPKTNRNADGSLKTITQLMKATLTVLQYGRYLASQGYKA